MHRFHLGPNIYTGEGSLPAVLRKSKKVFIVTDKFMHTSGKVAYITDYLDSIGSEYTIYSDIKADPDVDTVVSGMKLMLDFGADYLVALGGGSAIDTAKAIKYFIYLQNKESSENCGFAAIPTTSGTGSEVTSYAVITDPQKAVKYPISDEMLLPDAAILDAALVLSVPQKITADTGIDALTHAVEAFVSVNRSDCSDSMAEKAMRLIFKNLPKVYANPNDLEARQAMHNAACMAGIAFDNAGLGIVHAMSHALGAKFHISHGRSCALMLPYAMSFNAGCNTQLTNTAGRYAELAAVLNLDKSGVRQGALSCIRAIRTLLHRVGVPASLKEYGIDRREFEEMLPAMIDAAMADATLETTPEKCTREEMEQIYRNAYHGIF